MNNQTKATLIRALTLFAALCAVVAVLSRSRFVRGKETLAEYADKNGIPVTSESIPTAPETAANTDTTISSSSDEKTEFEPSEGLDGALTEETDAVVEEEPVPDTEVTVFTEGFYYETLSDSVKESITGVSFPEDSEGLAVTYDDLRLLHVKYINFHGVEHNGELICNKQIADDLAEIFYGLYEAGYQIEKICLIDEYGGDDTLSMEDNNTSCFNYRNVDNSSNLSKHALGLAIDLNPFYNPYVTYPGGNIRISPAGSEPYADRSSDFPYKIDENDLAYKLFTEHGFIWGGNWNSLKDYQHFQKNPE